VLQLHGGCVGFSTVSGIGSIFYAWLEMDCRARGAARAPVISNSTAMELSEYPNPQTTITTMSHDALPMDHAGSLVEGKRPESKGSTSISLEQPEDQQGAHDDHHHHHDLKHDTNSAVTEVKKRRVVKRKRGSRGVSKAMEGGCSEGIDPKGHGHDSHTFRSAGNNSETNIGQSHSLQMTVLIVDDSRTNRIFMERMVMSCMPSARVLSAEDGEDGLRALDILADEFAGRNTSQRGVPSHRKLACDLILLDFSMPRMTGPEMATAVRADARLSIRDIPIVGVTGNALKEDQDYFKRCGALEVLTKPIRRLHIAGALRQYSDRASDIGSVGLGRMTSRPIV